MIPLTHIITRFYYYFLTEYDFELHRHLIILARDAFLRTNCRAIAMLFVRPSVQDGRVLWSYGAR